MHVPLWAGVTVTQRVRRGILVCIGLNLVLASLRAELYQPFWTQPGAIAFLLAPVAGLLLYAAGVVAITVQARPARDHALRTATRIGLVTGAMWIGNLALETFSNVGGSWGLLATAPFLLGGFVLWGVAAYLAARTTHSLVLGVLAALLSAMICVLLTVTFGFLLMYTALPRLEHDLLNDPDWLRSGWSDLGSFAIANTLYAGFTHLVGGMIVATIVGATGGYAAILQSRWTGSSGASSGRFTE